MSTTSSSSRGDRLEGERGRRLAHLEVTMFPPPSYEETCTSTTNATPVSGTARRCDGPASTVYQVQAGLVASGRIWHRRRFLKNFGFYQSRSDMVIGYFRLELLLRLAKRPLSIFLILAGKLSFMREKVVSRGKEKVVSRGSLRYFDKTEFHSKRTKKQFFFIFFSNEVAHATGRL